ncbi:MAG TPA: energy transducer TonB [Vicinamibacterales bacterium]
MPRDLFGDVTRPSISIGNRKWYTVPVSLFSHAIVLATVVIAPIIAAPYMPAVLGNDNPDYIITMMPPPPAPPPIADKLEPVANPDAAPVVPPDGITKEPETIQHRDVDVIRVPGGVADASRDLVPPPPPIVKQPEPPIGPVRVGTHSIRTPVKTRDVRPVYPRMAQEARIEGVVIIEATISESGQVINAKLLRSVPLLDQAAIEAVRQWQFTPSLLNGVPVPVIMTVTVTFTLSR